MSNLSVNDVIAYENGELDGDEQVQMFQRMIDDGSAWRLQGCYGRQAMQLIEAGLCTLGSEGHRDAYGNYVPSKFEVQPGTKGSEEYARKMRERES